MDNDKIKQLEKEVKDLKEEKEIINSQIRINDIDENIYNTNQSIKELRKYGSK